MASKVWTMQHSKFVGSQRAPAYGWQTGVRTSQFARPHLCGKGARHYFRRGYQSRYAPRGQCCYKEQVRAS